MPSDLMEAFIESSADKPGGPSDPRMLLSRTLAVPRNSGIQNVFPEIMTGLDLAGLLKGPLRNMAIQMAKNPLYGISAISSEDGFMTKELNTNRIHQTLGQNVGQSASEWDEYMYGKKFLKNNPKHEDNFMKI